MEHTDIVIAGGGMVGISLALQLAKALPSDTSLLMVEGFALPDDSADRGAYHPSFDSRSTALSYSSKLIYQRMGLWEALSNHACPIETIHVSTRGRFGSTVLRACDYGWDALGFVMENAWMGRCLAAALSAEKRIETLSPARVVAAQPDMHGVTVEIAESGRADGAAAEEKLRRVRAGLLVVADGADSALCRQLGMTVHAKPYGQHALIANVATAKEHAGFAYERFTESGPLALLPLAPVPEQRHRSALVWTLPPDEASWLSRSSTEEFLRALQQSFGYRLGRVRSVGERATYPLALSRAEEQVRQGVVVMGNAAHALHPVAGQGFNLALRSVAQLAQVLAEGLTTGLPPGDLGLLQRYRRRQAQDQERTITFSDQVPSLFMHSDLLVGAGRDLALAGMDMLPAVKRAFVRHAAGVAALNGASDG